ncbi:MAG TPA: leucine-rich repeat domain-containing protein [Ohtaekwangia sp.]|uniref:leucine-rich repeat domain-containing protein n=1 Tax=Ohtaekwangia sp. TaxID=2066019 RepID=UPI002F949DF6
MKESKLWLIVFLLFAIYTPEVLGQAKKQNAKTKQTKQTTQPKQPAAAKQEAKQDPTLEHQQKVKDMVAFLEYVLNTLGSSSTPARDKDVLITQSYTKIFRDAKVQVEDDLVEKRNVITNKDVQAYLKDVDFFFENVKFEFTIKDIQGRTNINNTLFYKVSLLRNIKGTTADGKSVNNTIPRYIEVNYDPKDEDLKIVSIYTKVFNEKEALAQWWDELSYEWQSIFEKQLNITDSVDEEDIHNITSIETLDLSRNKYIQDLEPLTELTKLRALNLSNTAITDLSALRNLSDLQELNLSNTKITDISALRYAEKMLKLNISNTTINNIEVVEKMPRLTQLELSKTPVIDLTSLGSLTELQYLDISDTRVTSLAPVSLLSKLTELDVSGSTVADLSSIAGLKDISILHIDSTGISDITPLANLGVLKILYANYTAINNLNALQRLTNLEKIYCDHTQIDRSLADAFMAAHPGVLVIYNTEDLKTWWNALPERWKYILSTAIKTSADPSKEELARVTNLDSINFSNNAQIRDIEPLRRLLKLQVIIANKTSVKDLSPLRELREVKFLDISDTPVEDLSSLTHLQKLQVLKADNSKIQSIAQLLDHTSLQKLYTDHTRINDVHVAELLQKNPHCLVIYKSDSLAFWWSGLSEEWKSIFKTQVKIQSIPTREDLHQLIELEALHFNDAAVTDLVVLKPFIRLKELHFSGTNISELLPLTAIKTLKSLHVTNSPVRKLEPLAQLAGIEDLDISNTPVEELAPLTSLENLKRLNCSGTQVDALSSLEKLQALEYIDCSNTNVKKITALENLPLKTLKCYNTKISSKTIAAFKKSKPDCQIVYY